MATEIYTGFGFDSHAFEEGKKNIVLGGVEIPFEKGVKSHSDGDVLIHALIDALFGAAGMEDIGAHFPDTDERYRNISSLILLDKTVVLLKERGYRIVNADFTVIAERPKLSSYGAAVKRTLASRLQVEEGRIALKAKTAEGLGFVGEGRGLAVFANVLVRKDG